MKGTSKIAFICLTFSIIGLMGCNKDLEVENGYSPNPNSQKGIVGSWKLVEVLADPGDGSGTFQPVTSNKIIQIFADSTFIANGQMCDMNTSTVGSETGILLNSTTLELTLSPCLQIMQITYKRTGNELILTYPCFEACRQKYIKI